MKMDISLYDLANAIHKDDLDRDVTDTFFSLYNRAINIKDFGFSMLCWGSKGGGKSVWSMVNAHLIMERDRHIFKWIDEISGEECERERHIAFLLVPQSFIDNLKDALRNCNFDYIANRVRAIKKLREVKNNDILVIDEGLIGANGKRP